MFRKGRREREKPPCGGGLKFTYKIEKTPQKESLSISNDIRTEVRISNVILLILLILYATMRHLVKRFYVFFLNKGLSTYNFPSC
jgi:hypothetical protein